MIKNSKERHLEILAAAAAVLGESGVDVSERVAIPPLAKLLAERTGCHYETAKQHIAKAVRRAGGGVVKEGQWGGLREANPGGRPRKEEPSVGR